ncbi:mpv17-like protein isoform X1 [Gorilla gorilla gorilla]|uniref:mpv17-like protein isoform X1 n=1 Tax=Gorilla gorilla gorilla TaxID=9595 RepID=UPI002445D6CB|nr:mpv17-like protein [Gorilla gorilla gorilla]
MAGWWPALSRAVRRHPWPTNVLLYGSLVSAGDVLQQRLQGREANWRQTRRVATLVVTFHANFDYVWLGLLERALPGRAPHAVLAKLLCDQVVGAPIAVSAFYVGMSILQGNDDIFLDLKQKFWNTYLSYHLPLCLPTQPPSLPTKPPLRMCRASLPLLGTRRRSRALAAAAEMEPRHGRPAR